ncbi:MAG: HepT-like ribonuclease domain-containing protein [Terricaulis sp.]
MMEEATRFRLQDMLEYARLAVSILGQADEKVLAVNAEKRLAVVRAVEVIGEAANAIDPAQRAGMSAVPWDRIRAMRNRLIHNYGRIDHGILVDTVRNHIPSLIVELERILNAGAQGTP